LGTAGDDHFVRRPGLAAAAFRIDAGAQPLTAARRRVAFSVGRCYRNNGRKRITMFMKKLILLIIVLAAGIAIGIYLQKQPKTKTIENNAQTDAADVKADVKAGVDKTKEVATNVAADVKEDAQKVHDATTNAVGEIKDKIP
jgi:uncharacterized protein HemX